MEYQITISKRAEKRIDDIFEYLEQKWPNKVKEDFKIKLLKQVDFLRQNPHMFPVSQVKDGLRKCLITKHNALYYRIKEQEVEIITIHDTRQNPKTLIL
ncbi:MAG: hypothetical protein B6I20_02340 [Bacteroidetes bacterium 4572_117]|nr:MAG: hypothetical protein B6I20_02340 [Bacteroidetes bacterium 4572_117]